MRLISTRLILGLLLVSALCVMADPVQAGPFRRRGASSACCGSGGGYGYGTGYSGYGGSYYGGGYGGGYGGSSCCGGATYGSTYGGPVYGGGYSGGAMYQPGYAYGGSYATPSCCGGNTMTYGGYGYGGTTYGMPYASGYDGSYIPAGGGLYNMPGSGGILPAAGGGTGAVPGILPSRGQETNVKATDGKFEPANVTVTPGSTVRWKNEGKSPITISSTKNDWGSGEIPPGGEFTATFTQAGTFDYACKEHKDMKGTVTVK